MKHIGRLLVRDGKTAGIFIPFKDANTTLKPGLYQLVEMIEKEDIIVCNSYANLPGIIPWGNFRGRQLFDAPPDGATVFVTTDDCAQFFRLHGNNGRRYTLVSACSDFGVAYQKEYPYYQDIINYIDYLYETAFDKKQIVNIAPEVLNAKNWIEPGCDLSHKYSVRNHNHTYYTFPEIPSNIIKWHQTNSYLFYSDDPKINYLPFGIADGDRDILYQVMQETEASGRDRFDGMYVNMSPNTIQRAQWLEWLRALKHPRITIREGGLSKYDYMSELAQHKCCLVLEGNGIDSYRLWESFYLGAVPIVPTDSNISHLLYEFNLPFDFISFQDESESINYRIEDAITYMQLENQELLEMSYWQKEIFNGNSI